MQNKTTNQRDLFFTRMTKDYIVITYMGETLIEFQILEQTRTPKEQVMHNHGKAQRVIRDIMAGTSEYLLAQAQFNAMNNLN